jgi:hypothetical protein
MPRYLLFGLIASICASIAPSASAAEPFTAGERRLVSGATRARTHAATQAAGLAFFDAALRAR